MECFKKSSVSQKIIKSYTYIIEDPSSVIKADVLPTVSILPPILKTILGYLDNLVLLLDGALAPGLIQIDVVNLGPFLCVVIR